MASESEFVKEGLARTESSGQALDQIIEMAEKVGDMVIHIAESSAKQDVATMAVNENIAQIAQMSADASTNANHTTQECTHLAALAISLREVVDQFKLDGRSEAQPD
jgi:methyl-accepting chemotaxis protein